MNQDTYLIIKHLNIFENYFAYSESEMAKSFLDKWIIS